MRQVAIRLTPTTNNFNKVHNYFSQRIGSLSGKGVERLEATGLGLGLSWGRGGGWLEEEEGEEESERKDEGVAAGLVDGMEREEGEGEREGEEEGEGEGEGKQEDLVEGGPKKAESWLAVIGTAFPLNKDTITTKTIWESQIIRLRVFSPTSTTFYNGHIQSQQSSSHEAHDEQFRQMAK